MKDIKKIKQELQKIYEAIFSILEYYKCPADCHAFCCKQCPVDLTDKEYNKFRRLSPEKTEKSKIVKYDHTYVHQLDQPCPFLGSDELCTAYNIRPERCHIYPFNITDTFSYCMQIYPCMIGVKISKDYFKYKIYSMSAVNDIRIFQVKSEISSVLKNLDERSNVFYSSIDSKIENIGVPFNEIFEFLNYLKETGATKK